MIFFESAGLIIIMISIGRKRHHFLTGSRSRPQN